MILFEREYALFHKLSKTLFGMYERNATWQRFEAFLAVWVLLISI